MAGSRARSKSGTKKVCFVIMGFGKKTDYSNPEQPPRTLDLNATYESIIKPAVTSAGLDCVRADEISHSGVIDKVMYEMLLRADLVIADISTANPNALYELGVRHALRPRTTIVIKEVDGKFIFDLNHLATLQYKHLGEDIGAREAEKRSKELKDLVVATLASDAHDSPVYTYLKGLREPVLSKREFRAAVERAVRSSEGLSKEVELALLALKQEDAARGAATAAEHFRRALKLQQRPLRSSAGGRAEATVDPDPYLVQQLALHTYKAKKPTPRKALEAAWKELRVLHPETSTDPETLGIGGAIQKRLFDETSQRKHLDLAIELYGRGFEVRRDYYNGENYALCLRARADLQADAAEAEYDRRTAQKVVARVVASLEPQLRRRETTHRSDYHWMLASLSIASYALGRQSAARKFEKAFLADRRVLPWMRETFANGKERALKEANQ